VDALELSRGADGRADRAIKVIPPGAKPCRGASQTKPTPARERPESPAALRSALARRTKAELVEVLLELAQAGRSVLRQLTARLDVAATPVELIAATRQAIADATAFDKRDLNRNFDYDYEAYSEVKRNLSRLINSGNLRVAMQLALELMQHGSYQVESSDEGLMTQDIEDGLSVILKALLKCDIPAPEIITWCAEMRANDRVGFIAQQPLHLLQTRFETAQKRQPPLP
jgi:hypothetical protein